MAYRHLIGPIATAGALLMAAGCGGSGSTDADREGDRGDSVGPHQVILDYSPTLSDVTALLYLTQHPDVELLAVTLSGTGESHCGPGLANTIGLLEMAGLPDVPVACGPTATIGPGNDWPDEWRERSDALVGIDIAAPSRGDHGNAVDLLATIASQQERPVTIVAVGPLTNLAATLRQHDDFASNVSEIYTMGGAFDISGNAPNRSAEWNYYIDPASVDVVFESGIPITVIPLDATDDVPVTKQWYGALTRHRTTAAATAVHDLLAATPSWELGFSFWDELAAAVVLDPTLVTYEVRRVSVVTDGERAGRTRTDDQGTSVRVAVSADATRFERELLTGLNAGAPPPEPLTATSQEVAYFDAVGESASKLDAKIGELFESPEAAVIDEFLFDEPATLTPEQEQAVRRFMETFWTGAVELIGTHAAELSTLQIPASVQQSHDAYLAAIDALVDGEAERLKTLADLEGDDLLGFLWATDTSIERVDATCAQLEMEALLRNLDGEFCPA
jgi:inosine-uridine nucleoside N-ribohydrolase